MDIKDSSLVGNQVLQSKKAIIIGVSINNSYFSEENLKKLLLWAWSYTTRVYVMIPDEPAVHTLIAFGKSQGDAERVARLKSNALENKCRAIIQEKNLTSVQIVRWKNIVDSEHYQSALDVIKREYSGLNCFAKDVNETTLGVLRNAGFDNPTLMQIENGVQFLFKELAFITHSSLILKEENTAYIYHSTMKVLKDILEGQYSFYSTKNVGFVTVE